MKLLLILLFFSFSGCKQLCYQMNSSGCHYGQLPCIFKAKTTAELDRCDRARHSCDDIVKQRCGLKTDTQKRIEKEQKCKKKCDKRYKKVKPFKSKREKINACLSKCLK